LPALFLVQADQIAPRPFGKEVEKKEDKQDLRKREYKIFFKRRPGTKSKKRKTVSIVYGWAAGYCHTRADLDSLPDPLEKKLKKKKTKKTNKT